MNLNFYSKAISTLVSFKRSFVFCLVAAFLIVNNSQAQTAGALTFDGVDDNVSVPVKPALNISSNITIEAWIKPTKSAGAQDIVSKSAFASNTGYIFRTVSGWTTLDFWINFNGYGARILRVPYGADKINQWHHVAATYDGYTMRIYIDAVLAGSFNFAGNITVNSNPLSIGYQNGYTNEYYGGSMDDVRIWNRALSQCEIGATMNCELPASQTGLVAYYKFNQGVAGGLNLLETTLQDASPTGANGTLSNFGLLNLNLTSNWTTGIASGTCSPFVPTTVTAGSVQSLIPIGGDIQLTASAGAGATYSWTGPAGFTSTEQNPVISGVGLNASGTYTVVATIGGCSGTASTVITVAPMASGLTLDGVDDYVSVPNSPYLNSSQFSVEAWIYPTGGVASIQNVLTKSTQQGNNTGYKFPMTEDKWSSFSFVLSVDGVFQTLSAPIPGSGLNKWSHVAATFDGYFMRIYLNGVLVGTKEVTGNVTFNNNNLIIGNNDGRVEYFKGTVDELRIWNRAVSQCEIINNMQTCELNGESNGLANQTALGAYYRFNQGMVNVPNTGGINLADSSGHGNNGTLYNFTLAGNASNWSDGKVYGICAYFPLPTLAASANGSVFQTGTTAKLFAVNGNNNTYAWEGPNSFATSTQNPVLNNAQPSASGTYTVSTPYVNCVVTASTRIQVTNTPQIIANGPTSICPSGSVVLSSATTGTSYQWFLNDAIIPGATADSYTATAGGSYSVTVTNGTTVIISAQLVVTVIPDVTAPVADLASLPTLNLVAPATVTTIPTATDNCRGTVNGTSDIPLTFTHSGTYTITWTYNDGNGNTSVQTQSVVVARPVDVTPPVLTVPANQSANATVANCGAVVNFAATATDESEDPTVTITYTQNPGTVFPVGTTTVTVTATDAAGNSSTGSFTVTVAPTVVAAISGTTSVCAGSTTTLSTTSTGGVWSSDNTSVATVNAAGVVTALTAGTANIIYTNGCGATASATVTVNAIPSALSVGVSNNCGTSTLTASGATGSILWSNAATTASITVSNNATYTVTQTLNGCTSASASGTSNPGALPATPVVTVSNSCGSSTLTASNTTGSILWSNGATTASITVTNNATYTVTQTIGSCTSAAGTGTANPGVTPATPVVTVVNNCGSSTLTVSNATGNILWSNGATTASITVLNSATYTVTQTVGSCTSAAGSGTSSPVALPSAPTVTVVNNCGSSTLTASNTTGSILWSNGATTASITVSNNATYTVTQKVGACTSTAGSGTSNPAIIPAAPTVTVSNNCGSSTLTASNTTGSILWSNGATTASITVSNNATYTVTQTVGTCTSAAGSGTSNPSVVPSAPTVTVVDNCGSSTLTASNTTGSILWSNGATTASITVSNNATYTVTQKVGTCTSAAGSGTSNPKAVQATPLITVTNNCGSTTLSTNASGNLSWSNGATTSSIIVTTGGNYTVTVTNTSGCSATSAVAGVTINTAPVVSAITGNTTVTAGSSTQLADATAGGVWSSNSANATVNASGLVTGVNAGTATISYTVTSGAGCATTVSTVVTVNALPTCTTPVINAIANISATTTSQCSAPVNYTATVSGTPAPALTYSFTGATTGSGSGTGSGSVFNVGTTTVTIKATNSCGFVTRSFTITVSDATAPTAIAKNITVALDANGQAIVTPAQVDNGSSDNCSNITLAFKTTTSSTSVITGTVCATADENGNVVLTAPNGGVITAINFASYGTPNGTCGSFTLGACNASNSKSIVEGYALGKNSVTIPATNSVFGDPCYGTQKRLYVQATYQANVSTNATSINVSSLLFDCSKTGANTVTLSVTDAAGNTTTQNAIVTIVDNASPVVTAVANQTFCGTAGSFTVPALTATDNCSIASVTYAITGATSRTGTGYNASGTFNTGTSTITWTVKDAANNITSSSTTVIVGGGPVATITASGTSTDACSELILTGSSSVSGATYKWLSGTTVVGTAQQFSLGQASAEGTYQLVVTANGCSSTPASYSFNKQNLLSSYTILVYDDVKLGKYNKVATGSVGVMSSWGDADFESNTSVNGPNSFVKSPDINLNGYNINITRQINGVVSIPLPAMQYNTSNANGYSSYSTAQYSTVTLSSNYKNLTIRKGTYATLSGTIFGTINLEEGASVRFTNPTINIDKLLVDDGARDGYYSYVRFAPNSSVRVSTQVMIGSQVLVNPDNYKVTFYMGDNRCDNEKFSVKGADTKVIANIYMPNGKLKVTSTDSDNDYHSNCNHGAHSWWNCGHGGHNHHDCDHKAHSAADCNDDVYMTGLFIVEDLESKGNTVIFNSFDCNSGSVPVVVINKTAPSASYNASTLSVTKEGTESATTEEELKITVMPNPSTTYFTLKFESKYETPVSMRVMDASGRVVDAQTKIGSNSTIRIGASYASGTYYAEMIQGSTRKVVQLMKVK